MKEPVDHVIRPTLPWRSQEYTECGRPLNDVTKVITRQEWRERLKDLGKTRAAMITCVTCYEAAERHRTWDEDPVDALRREVGYGYGRQIDGLRDELRAVAALVQAHRDEFDGYLEGIAATTSLDDARRERRLRAARGTHTPRGGA